MKSKDINRVMAYIYVPLLFAIIGCFFIYLVISPYITEISMINLVLSENSSDNNDIKSIFKGPDESIIKEDPQQTDPIGNEPLKYIDEKDIVIPNYGEHYANLKIDSVSVNADLYYGDNEKILKKGLGQYMGSFIPGYGKPLLISGHNNRDFNKLKGVNPGDIITITTNYGIYEYKITETRIAKASDSSAYDLSQSKEQCILYTCYPFDMLGLTENRFFVYADKISGPVIKENIT